MGGTGLPGAHDGTDDELALAFPDCSFSHLLSVVSQDRIRSTIAILAALNEVGCRLDSLRVTRVSEKLEHRCRLTGLRPHQARLLANRLSTVAGVERATVEHQILRPVVPGGIVPGSPNGARGAGC